MAVRMYRMGSNAAGTSMGHCDKVAINMATRGDTAPRCPNKTKLPSPQLKGVNDKGAPRGGGKDQGW